MGNIGGKELRYNKMKKILLILIILIGGVNKSNSQNIVSVGRTLLTRRPTVVTRIINTNIADSFVSIDVAKYQSLNTHTNWSFTNTSTNVEVTIQRQLAEYTLKSPRTIYGPYNYVRTFSKLSKEENLTSKRHIEDWKKISQTTGYNGAHHIINKYTLKLIYEDMKKHGQKVNLVDMQNNAPAIFHPYHGDPRFKHIFHNPEQQLHDYQLYGMKITIGSLLAKIDAIGQENGIPPMPIEYLMGILKEAELWCRTYGLVWQRDTHLTDDMLFVP